MAVDFPNNRNQLVPPLPSGPIQNGDVYIYKGITYTAKILGTPPNDSVQWNAATSAGNDGYVLKVGDTMTGQLTLPGAGTGKQAATVDQVTAVDTASVAKAGDTMTGNLNLPNLVATGDIQSTSQNGSQIAGFRNHFINGDFRIAQRGSGPVTTILQSGNYSTVDRFTVDDVTAQQVNVTDLPGFSKALNISAGGRYLIRQPIELETPGNPAPYSAGTQWTFSIWSTVRVTSVQAGFSDNKSNNGYVEVFNSNSIQTLETSGSWTRYGFTFTVQSGLSLSSQVCLNMLWYLETAGSITGAQLEPGPVATPFEHRPIGTELALCQRYFYKFVGELYASPYARSGVNGDYRVVNFTFLTTMRSTPTMNNVTFTGGGSGLQISANPSGISVIQTPKEASNSAALRNFEADAEL